MSPSLIDRWQQELLQGPAPQERRADCARCGMCAPEVRELGLEPFSPSTKCCTFFPDLYNFNVGAALEDPETAAGALRLREAIAARRAVTPLGVFHVPDYHRRFMARGHAAFGRDEAGVCPYYQRAEGRCGVWPYRGSTCSTWFCRHERGRLGQQLWESLRQATLALEQALALACVQSLAPELAPDLLHPDGRLRDPAAGELSGYMGADGVSDACSHEARWGRWAGQEEAFFRACAEQVEALEVAEARAHGGARLVALEHAARRALAALRRPRPPGPLRLAPAGQMELEDLPDGRVALRTHNAHDPIAASPSLLEALAEGGAEAVEPELLGALLDRGVVEPGEAPAGGPLDPEQRLRVAERHALELEVDWDEAGRARVHLTLGPQEVELDDPGLLDFGRLLYAHRSGFRAAEAAGWGRVGGWEGARPLLEALLAEEILVRVG